MHRRDHRPWMPALAGVIGCGLLLSGCSDTSGDSGSADPCAQLNHLVQSVDAFQAADPVQAQADDLRAKIDQLRGRIDAAKVGAGDRLDAALTALETKLDDLQSQLAAAGAQAQQDVASWKAEVDALLAKWAVVRDRIQARCG
jgi:hypothetical protein